MARSVWLVAVNSPPWKTGVRLPPAMPHGSETGASPGLRHGMYFQTSSGDPAVALRLALRYAGRLSVGLNGAARSAAQWSQFAKRVPLPSQALQPGVQPATHNRQDRCTL